MRVSIACTNDPKTGETMKFTIQDSDCMPPISGGYLVIYVNDKELDVVSVPSPNLGADRYRDSTVDNYEIITDDKDNVFKVLAQSSNVGVDWTIEVSTNDPELESNVRVEYLANEF